MHVMGSGTRSRYACDRTSACTLALVPHALTRPRAGGRARTSTDQGTFPYALARVLGDEVEQGRVALDDAGRYRLVPDAFDHDVLAALRVLVL
jgi:hypothetical protein